MGVSYYFDVHVRRAVTEGLRLRGIDVLTAQDDGRGELGDAELMDRALELGRVVFTQDRDFLVEAGRRQESGESFAGVIYAHQLNITIGGVRRRLGVDCENLRARRNGRPRRVPASQVTLSSIKAPADVGRAFCVGAAPKADFAVQSTLHTQFSPKIGTQC